MIEDEKMIGVFAIIDDNGGRRKNGDRRQFCYTVHIPERRCGLDRRAGEDRRKQSRISEKSRMLSSTVTSR